MAGIESGISTALTYADDNTHGYELRERDYDIGTDCAGLGRLYAAAVEGVSVASYPDMHSWDIADKLRVRGWQVIDFSEGAKQRGDILVRVDPKGGTGHVVIYLGDGRIVGAEGDWDGKRGDSSGREICERSYYSYGYKYIVRLPEGAGKVSIEKVDNAVYRLYNPNAGQHLFTAGHSEAESLASIGWEYEGVAFNTGNSYPIYRLYNPFGGAHMFTASSYEGMNLAVSGWVVECIAFYAGGSVPVYRVYNPGNGDHVFTTSDKECDNLLSVGWADEGIAFTAN